jgi:hypothetical protein
MEDVMKKLPEHEVAPNLGKPPKGAVFERRPLEAHEIDWELHRQILETLMFKQTTHEDFDRIRAELKNEFSKV